MISVQLIDYTSDALAKLLYTKDTRLMGSRTLDEIKAWPMEQQLEHLAYMKDTIQSSWEFVSYTFELKGVTRAFTHQLVRTRTGSYAQQSQRTVDARELEVVNPIPPSGAYLYGASNVYDDCVDDIKKTYTSLIDDYDVPAQDARGLLPTNITTDIIAKFDLRTLHNMGLLRLCTRTQGEYQQTFKMMRDRVIEVHPWAKDFIKVHCAWYGTCAFPRYTECPIQKYTLDQGGAGRRTIDAIWEATEHEARPVASDAMTMPPKETPF